MAERRHSTLPLLERLPGHRNTRLTRLTLPVSTCNLTRSFSNGEKLQVIAGGGSAQALTFSQKFHPEKMRRENAPVEAVPTLLRLNKKTSRRNKFTCRGSTLKQFFPIWDIFIKLNVNSKYNV
jgi:hypothetical protein